jgi:hypothetical protein
MKQQGSWSHVAIAHREQDTLEADGEPDGGMLWPPSS